MPQRRHGAVIATVTVLSATAVLYMIYRIQSGRLLTAGSVTQRWEVPQDNYSQRAGGAHPFGSTPAKAINWSGDKWLASCCDSDHYRKLARCKDDRLVPFRFDMFIKQLKGEFGVYDPMFTRGNKRGLATAKGLHMVGNVFKQPPDVVFILYYMDAYFDKPLVERVLNAKNVSAWQGGPLVGQPIRVKHVYVFNFWDSHLGLNSTWTHPKFSQLPLGFQYNRGNTFAARSRQTRCETVFAEKPARVLAAFSTGRKSKDYISWYQWPNKQSDYNPRTDAVNALRNNLIVTQVKDRVNQSVYMQYIQNHSFVISPSGLGPDCYRTWEAIWLNSVPIVLHSPMDKLYDGFPVVKVKQWSDVNATSVKMWHEEISNKFSKSDWERVQYRLTVGYVKECVRSDFSH